MSLKGREMIGLQADYGGAAERFIDASRDVLSSLAGLVSPGRLVLQFLVAGALVEAILAVRVWAQLTAHSVDTGLTGFLFKISDGLIVPFEHFELATPIKATGIIELSTLVAMEAYLVATLAAVIMVVSARPICRVLTRVFAGQSAAAETV